MRRRRVRLLAALVVAASLGGACTDDEPADPSPTPAPTGSPAGDAAAPRDQQPDVAVVLPAAGEPPRPRDAYEEAVDRARASFGGDLGELREVSLDGARFRLDVLRLLGDEGTALSCALGAGARDVVAVARELPGQRFCAVDDRIDDVPANVVVAWFRYEEAAYLLGSAAARMLPPDAAGTLGFVTPTLDARSQLQRQAFTAGARAAHPEVSVTVATLDGEQGATPEERAATAAARLYDETDAAVIFLTAGTPIEPVLREAQERLRLVIGLGPPLSRGAPPGLEPFVLATAHARLELGLAVPLTRVLEGWSGGVVSLGFADDALVLTPGGSVRWNEIRGDMADLRERIERGEVAVT